MDAYLAGHKNTIDALKNLREIAIDMKNALLKGDLSSFGQMLNENWKNQKRLHPSVTNPQIDSLFDLLLENGASGGKACGAGGGGCLVFWCASDKEHIVRKKLEEAKVDMIDFTFDFNGLQTWNVL